MAIPKLTDSSGANAVTFTKGEAFPFQEDPYVGNQVSHMTRDGYARVRKNGDAKRLFQIVVNGENSTVAAGLELLFGSYVDWMVNTFRYYPDATSGTYRTVRLTKPSIVNEWDGKSPSTDKMFHIVIECKEE